MKAELHPSETQRLAALQRYDILDTPREAEFDDIVAIVSSICETPISVINLIDSGRQWFKAEVGLGVRETPIDSSICAHAILQPDLFVVPDTTKDSRFCDNPLVTGDPELRFYAGALLETPDGLPLGTLCVLDYMPRDLNDKQRSLLRVMAAQVMKLLELRRINANQHALWLNERNTSALREQFIAVLGHDLRNPLAAIDGGVRLMRKTPLDEKATKYAELIQKSVTRMSGLIDNVMDFARGRLGGGLTLDRNPEKRLEPILRQVVAELQLSAPDRLIEAHFALPSQIDCDRRRIAQLASNLLGNALSHGAPDKPIRFSAITKEGWFELSVAQCRRSHTRNSYSAHFRTVLARKTSAESARFGLGALYFSCNCHCTRRNTRCRFYPRGN